MTFKTQLNAHWTAYCQTLPEYGMGFQLATLIHEDGSHTPATILNCEIAQTDTLNASPIVNIEIITR